MARGMQAASFMAECEVMRGPLLLYNVRLKDTGPAPSPLRHPKATCRPSAHPVPTLR